MIVSVGHPQFPSGIQLIVRNRSKKQMLWVYAKTIVALVANAQTGRNRTFVK